MSDKATVATIPVCDLCHSAPAAVDGKTKFGPWANMCSWCWSTHGVGKLGTGFGQALVLADKA
jgi:hypothetical protein